MRVAYANLRLYLKTLELSLPEQITHLVVGNDVIVRLLERREYKYFCFCYYWLVHFVAYQTWDQSLTDAIAAGQSFVYDLPDWKLTLFAHLYLLARKFSFMNVATFLELNRDLYSNTSIYSTALRNEKEARQVKDNLSKNAADFGEDGQQMMSFFEQSSAITPGRLAQFYDLYFSDSLRLEFHAFDRRLNEIDFECWTIIAMMKEILKKPRL